MMASMDSGLRGLLISLSPLLPAPCGIHMKSFRSTALRQNVKRLDHHTRLGTGGTAVGLRAGANDLGGFGGQCDMHGFPKWTTFVRSQQLSCEIFTAPQPLAAHRAEDRTPADAGSSPQAGRGRRRGIGRPPKPMACKTSLSRLAPNLYNLESRCRARSAGETAAARLAALAARLAAVFSRPVAATPLPRMLPAPSGPNCPFACMTCRCFAVATWVATFACRGFAGAA